MLKHRTEIDKQATSTYELEWEEKKKCQTRGEWVHSIQKAQPRRANFIQKYVSEPYGRANVSEAFRAYCDARLNVFNFFYLASARHWLISYYVSSVVVFFLEIERIFRRWILLVLKASPFRRQTAEREREMGSGNLTRELVLALKSSLLLIFWM